MSALSRQSLANETQSLWEPFGAGGGGSTGPTGPTGSTGPTGPTGPAGKGGGIPPTQIITYQVPSGTQGGAAPSGGVFHPRPLNTGIPALDGTGNSPVIAGLSLDVLSTSTIITFPVGTYHIRADVGGVMLLIQARLWDVVGAKTLALGMTAGDDGRTTYSTIEQDLTFAAPTDVQVQFYGDQAVNIDDWGQPSSTGEDEVYVRVVITQLA
jgi:hypothetical protein